MNRCVHMIVAHRDANEACDLAKFIETVNEGPKKRGQKAKKKTEEEKKKEKKKEKSWNGYQSFKGTVLVMDRDRVKSDCGPTFAQLGGFMLRCWKRIFNGSQLTFGGRLTRDVVFPPLTVPPSLPSLPSLPVPPSFLHLPSREEPEERERGREGGRKVIGKKRSGKMRSLYELLHAFRRQGAELSSQELVLSISCNDFAKPSPWEMLHTMCRRIAFAAIITDH